MIFEISIKILCQIVLLNSFKLMCNLLFPFRRVAFLKISILVLGMLLITNLAHGQCTNRITAQSGTQQFSCSDVTVTSDGDVFYFYSCTNGPYHLGSGGLAFASYTFTFSHPVAGVILDFDTFNYNNINGPPGSHEVVTIEINGAPIAFPDAGLPSSCSSTQAVVNPSGGLQAPVCPVGDINWASCEDISIQTPISTITVTANILNGPGAGGVNFAIYFCCEPCVARAGLIPSSPFSLCQDAIATVPPAAPNVLPPGTLLQYILFSDLSDTLGSILSISNTPGFSFDPATMQTGVTYYIAAIAGKDLNGQVDLNDRCLDISDNAIQVTWWPKPTVVFSIDNPDVCKGDCIDFRIEFTGKPLFTLTYNNPFTGQITKTFLSHVGIIQLCIPLNAPAGSLNIESIKLTDEYCVCE